MAATIVKETGAGVDGANCYFTITELRAYYEAHQYSEAVDAISDDDDLIPAAITACREVDTSSEITGVPVDFDQDMAWPRLGARMRVDQQAAANNGVQVITGDENVLATGAGNIPANRVPKQWIKACMEHVRFVLAKDRSAAFDKPAVKREKIDVIEREYTEAGSAFDLIPEIVQRMVKPFTLSQEDQGAPPSAGGVGMAQAVRLIRS
jgi:hypothetical protein